jgi:hypothetical protein
MGRRLLKPEEQAFMLLSVEEERGLSQIHPPHKATGQFDASPCCTSFSAGLEAPAPRPAGMPATTRAPALAVA